VILRRCQFVVKTVGILTEKIGEQFQMNKYGSVGSVLERTKDLITKDRRLRGKVEKLVSQLSKSQEQT